MKATYKIIGLLLFLFSSAEVFAQTLGFNYQAIISSTMEIQVPGTNLNYLISEEIDMRFSIINSDGLGEYQEEHRITTSEYGEVNLIIGMHDPDAFRAILWDGSPKQLSVEIDYLEGLGYQHSNTRALLYLPHPFSSSDVTPFSNYVLIEAIRLGAGFDADGNYIQNSSTNYLSTAISLADADELLDAQIAANTQLINAINANNSDDQQLNLDPLSHTLTLEDGGSIDLTAYKDNTDDQTGTEVALAAALDANGDGTNEMNVEAAIIALVDTLFGCTDPLACNYNPVSIFGNTNLCTYANTGENCDGVPITVGMQYQGGYVFSYDPINNTGFIVSGEDLGGGTYDWGCYGTLTGASQTTLGTGQANTNEIIATNCSQIPSAVNVCSGYEKDGFTDWYLPAKAALTDLYNQLSLLESQAGFTAFQADKYWSSSEYDETHAYTKDFGTNFNDDFSIKSAACRIRAVRSF